jgi:hypothetical protein
MADAPGERVGRMAHMVDQRRHGRSLNARGQHGDVDSGADFFLPIQYGSRNGRYARFEAALAYAIAVLRVSVYLCFEFLQCGWCAGGVAGECLAGVQGRQVGRALPNAVVCTGMRAPTWME